MRCQPKRDLMGWLNSFSGSCGQRFLELRHGIAGRKPAQLTAFGRRHRILGHGFGDGRKVVAGDDPFANAEHLLLHGGVVEDLVRPQQDVPHAELVDHRALGAAHVVQLDDLKSAAALDGLGEIAGLHAHDEIGEQRG